MEAPTCGSGDVPAIPRPPPFTKGRRGSWWLTLKVLTFAVNASHPRRARPRHETVSLAPVSPFGDDWFPYGDGLRTLEELGLARRLLHRQA
jgi:hypothetical protein